MAERNPSEELDDAVEALMADRERPAASLDPRVAALMEIARDLRDLPNGAFRARLLADLLARAGRPPATSAAADYGPVLITVEDYLARITALGGRPPLTPFDLVAAFRDLPDGGTRFLTPLNECIVGVGRVARQSNWERHGSDELLHILEGDAEIETLTPAGPSFAAVSAGSLFICPEGLWHRVVPRSESVSLLFASPVQTEGSAERPQPATGGNAAFQDARDASPPLSGHALDAAVQGLQELTISSATTAAEADAAYRQLTTMGPVTLGVMRFAGLTPWERHPGGDELLHVLDGAVDLTVLTDAGPEEIHLSAGSVFVCPKGLWHRQLPRPSVTLLFGTATETTQASFADDPRVG